MFLPFKTRETVAVETPNSLAISFKETLFKPDEKIITLIKAKV